jgi:hypothetical protein
MNSFIQYFLIHLYFTWIFKTSSNSFGITFDYKPIIKWTIRVGVKTTSLIPFWILNFEYILNWLIRRSNLYTKSLSKIEKIELKNATQSANRILIVSIQPSFRNIKYIPTFYQQICLKDSFLIFPIYCTFFGHIIWMNRKPDCHWVDKFL